MVVRAYAKINLGLHILGQRSDGYHDLETVFHKINLFDELFIEQNTGLFEITSNDHRLPCDKNNLCWKAISLLQDVSRQNLGVRIHIMKNIPIGAGLGGGSSDAAVALTTLNQLFALNLSREILRDIALTLGSDVPFFLESSQTAYALGKGELLQPIVLPLHNWILLVTPPVSVSTRWAYQQYASATGCRRREAQGIDCVISSKSTLRNFLSNDFEPCVFKTYPSIQQLKELLISSGAWSALMSGSGSSVFGIFEEESSARKTQAAVSALGQTVLTAPDFAPHHD